MWQPVDTFPKDGSLNWVTCEIHSYLCVCLARYDTWNLWIRNDKTGDAIFTVQAWQPCPVPKSLTREELKDLNHAI